MNERMRPFVLYAAPTALVILIVGVFLSGRTVAIERGAARLDDAHERYEEHYLGPEAGRVPAREALRLAEEREADQRSAVITAETSLVAELPEEFTTDLFTNASGLQRRIMVGLRAQSERTAVPLPGSLPLESGLNPDDATRSVELAQLYLLQEAMRLVMGQAESVQQVELAGSYQDPTGRYAVFLMDLALRSDFRSAYTLLAALADNEAGLGLRSCELRPRNDEPRAVDLRCTVSMVTFRRDGWELGSDTTDSADAASDQRQRPVRGLRRLR
ncbi:MAG: hypothetical protein ACOCXJ_07180 [Planctomycetota bacterium]